MKKNASKFLDRISTFINYNVYSYTKINDFSGKTNISLFLGVYSNKVVKHLNLICSPVKTRSMTSAFSSGLPFLYECRY